MSQNKKIKDFEAYYVENFQHEYGSNSELLEALEFENEEYVGIHAQEIWETWQAAQQAAVPDGFVVLPAQIPKPLRREIGNFIATVDSEGFDYPDAAEAVYSMVVNQAGENDQVRIHEN